MLAADYDRQCMKRKAFLKENVFQSFTSFFLNMLACRVLARYVRVYFSTLWKRGVNLKVLWEVLNQSFI